mmetsp:Transcript_5974/g.13072  ORF Transcript_5974/g.13072 Transcript_5974/m.13072 type:complete len:96 (+) Transcript_5974:710-997(+)
MLPTQSSHLPITDLFIPWLPLLTTSQHHTLILLINAGASMQLHFLHPHIFLHLRCQSVHGHWGKQSSMHTHTKNKSTNTTYKAHLFSMQCLMVGV